MISSAKCPIKQHIASLDTPVKHIAPTVLSIAS
jgi:hypothetical protein